MGKAPRCELKCRQYRHIGLEFVQRKLGISLVGLLKHYGIQGSHYMSSLILCVNKSVRFTLSCVCTLKISKFKQCHANFLVKTCWKL